MPTVHFLGRVLPEVVNVSIDQKLSAKWQASEINLTMEFTISIVNSRLDIECKLNRYEKAEFVHVYMRALDLSRSTVNLVAFAKGYGLTVILDHFVDANNDQSAIMLKDDSLSLLCTAYSPAKGFGLVNDMVMQDPTLFLALNDLIESISLPHVSAVNCARAMERLKHLISPHSTKESEAWKQMRTALQIDEPYLKFITDHSTNPRHGRPGHIQGTITTEITRRAWTLMNRYFEYKKRGSNPLPLQEFPLLKE
jgi:hypothetical protein